LLTILKYFNCSDACNSTLTPLPLTQNLIYYMYICTLTLPFSPLQSIGALDDVSFFVGASVWYQGQLEREIEQGSWILCRGPAGIALTGVCEHEEIEEGEPRLKADLWLSMISACGQEEAQLAQLLEAAYGDDEYGNACDQF